MNDLDVLIGTVRMAIRGLGDDVAPLTLTTTCAECGATISTRRYDEAPDDDEQIDRDAITDAHLAREHRCA